LAIPPGPAGTWAWLLAMVNSINAAPVTAKLSLFI
jgi:hypothetical protein